MSSSLETYSLRESLVRGHAKVSKTCLIKKELREKKIKIVWRYFEKSTLNCKTATCLFIW